MRVLSQVIIKVLFEKIHFDFFFFFNCVGLCFFLFGRRKLSETMSMKGNDIADYLIENSKCLCVGVQKKGQNGGYVLNTKTHKNFWLLA